MKQAGPGMRGGKTLLRSAMILESGGMFIRAPAQIISASIGAATVRERWNCVHNRSPARLAGQKGLNPVHPRALRKVTLTLRGAARTFSLSSWACGPSKLMKNPEGGADRQVRCGPVTTREQSAGRGEKAMSHKSPMYGGGESSDRIVPTRSANKGRGLSAEQVEGRRSAEEIPRHGPMLDTEPENTGAI